MSVRLESAPITDSITLETAQKAVKDLEQEKVTAHRNLFKITKTALPLKKLRDEGCMTPTDIRNKYPDDPFKLKIAEKLEKEADVDLRLAKAQAVLNRILGKTESTDEKKASS